MGLPEGWTKYGADGKKISDYARYHALGNAIALPCADYIMAGIREALEEKRRKTTCGKQMLGCRLTVFLGNKKT